MADALRQYRSMRDFTETREPSGREVARVAPSKHLRFVIQKHDATRLHYDLRLEFDGVFKSWAVTRGPSLDPAEKRLAVEVEDHPLEYGDFEGTIPKAEYGGGTVMIWDRGFWAPETVEPIAEALAKGELKLALAGEKVRGSWVLVRMKRKRGEPRDNWLLIKHRDQWATPGRDKILAQAMSVASGRTMSAIASGKGKPPTPFMTRETVHGADAVWHSREQSAAAQTPVDKQCKKQANRMVSLPRLTHPERVLWPSDGVTKADLAGYLAAVAPWMIDHVGGRPCSLLRAPEGISGETFFQRHPLGALTSGLATVKVSERHAPYLIIESAQALADLAQISAIEFHPWNSAPGAPRVPGRLVFDLDPAPDVAFDVVVEAARELRDRLAGVGLMGFCKTTGGKGLHVVVPLRPDPKVGFDQAKLFTHTLAARMADAAPYRFVTVMSKRERTGKIFIDYLRNDLTATAVAPLSPRARPGALVSMPLEWTQVRRGLSPARFTLHTAPALLEKSRPWRTYRASARPLGRAIEKLLGRM